MRRPKLYALNLKGGHKYVGKTANFNRRVDQHIKGKGAKWTSVHRPVSVSSVRPMYSAKQETEATKALMKKHGIGSTRGGCYTAETLSAQTQMKLQQELHGNLNKCAECLRPGHKVDQCYARKSTQGRVLKH
jgi:predicted GIY-YIG superfamily endonuclease